MSNISKFLSGNLSNPSIYNAAAVCIYLGISLDEAFGMSPISKTDYDTNILNNQLHEATIRIEYLKQDRDHLEESLKSRKVIIAALLGICILMIAALGIGIIYDSVIQDAGFIYAGNIAPISIMCITSVVIAIAITVIIIGKYIYKTKKRDE